MKTIVVVVSFLLLSLSCVSYASSIEAWIGGSTQLNSSLALGFSPSFSIDINERWHCAYFFSIDKFQTWLGLEASLYDREFSLKREKIFFWVGSCLGLSAQESQNLKIDLGLTAHVLLLLSEDFRLEVTVYGNTKPELLFRIGIATVLLLHYYEDEGSL